MKFFRKILFLLAFCAAACYANGSGKNSGKWVVFVGCAGSGKGTQAEYFASKHNFIVIGMGDLLRKNKNMVATPNKETLGDIMKKGILVPNSITVDLIKKRLNEIEDVANKNVLFDGWPRVLEQAEEFEHILGGFGRKITVVFNFVIQDEGIVVKRILGRSSCKNCGKIYNDFVLKPAKEGICDVCGGTEFDRRADDNEESIKNRLKVFNEETRPVIEYYKKAGVLRDIKAEASVEEVRSSILNNLDLEKGE